MYVLIGAPFSIEEAPLLYLIEGLLDYTFSASFYATFLLELYGVC
jgi:hypothetical protein